MSKLHDALTRLRAERQEHSRPAPAAPVIAPTYPSDARPRKNRSWRIGYGLTAALLVVAVTGSVLVNIKTISQLENSGAMTLTLSKQMEEQKRELAAIHRYWMKAEMVRKNQREQIIALQKNVKTLSKNLEEAKSGLAKVEDLRINNKLMLEKFIVLNDRVKQMEEVKQ